MLSLVAVLAAARAVPGAEWASYLAQHLARHPLAAPEDVYKFVHQSVFGPAHFIPDAEAAQAYLEREVAELGPCSPGEPLLEPLSDTLVRVNLCPFVAAGGDRHRLLAALLESAATVQGEGELMRRRLGAAARLLVELGRREDASRLRSLGEDAAARGYPALHHSERYTQAYRPAYRVVLRRLLEPGHAPTPSAASDGPSIPPGQTRPPEACGPPP